MTRAVLLLRVFAVIFTAILTTKAYGQQYFNYRPRAMMIVDNMVFKPPVLPGGSYPPVLELSFTAFEEDFNLSLWQNVDLFAANYTRRMGDDNSDKFYADTGSLCQYTGKVVGANSSNVAIGICHGLHGLFHNGRDIFSIHSRDGHPEGGYLIQKKANHLAGQTKLSQEHGTRYIETIVVLDDAMGKKHSASAAFETSELIMSIANVMISPLNFQIVLKETVLDDGTLGLTSDQLSVERYRRQRHFSGDSHDFTLMISGFGGESYNLEGQTPLQGMCLTGYSVATVTNQYSEVMTSRIVAHSIGHSIGIGHDDPLKCTCNDRPCVMSMMAEKLSIHWSECSFKDLEKFFQREQDTCLRNRPRTLASTMSPVCGNGKVETGEECDCGNSCEKESCCDPQTCMYVEGAQCSKGDCCDVKNCTLKARSTVCRGSANECDLVEYCDGSTPECPADTYIQDGSGCNKDENYCFGGKCRTLDEQCKQLWGDSTEVAEESCFHSNKLGNKMSYCKYDRLSGTHEACSLPDIMCGVLFCTNVNSRNLIGSQWSTMKRELGVYRHGRTSMCTSTSIDLGLGVIDPGMVHDGIKCGADKVCLANKCVGIEHLNMSKNACSGRGVINNLGQCHCELGYGKNDCSSPGPGGSSGSGPASMFFEPSTTAQPPQTTDQPYEHQTTQYVPETTLKEEKADEKKDGSTEPSIVLEKETKELQEETLTEIDDVLDSLLDSIDEFR